MLPYPRASLGAPAAAQARRSSEKAGASKLLPPCTTTKHGAAMSNSSAAGAARAPRNRSARLAPAQRGRRRGRGGCRRAVALGGRWASPTRRQAMAPT